MLQKYFFAVNYSNKVYFQKVKFTVVCYESVNEIRQTVQIHGVGSVVNPDSSQDGGGGGYSVHSWVCVCHWDSKTLTLYQTMFS